jgi:DNA-binding XRE family transcriptional regulator
MDYKKIGHLIAGLRKEKHLTQKELADLLHLSDRTISKWERGAGCTDISLIGGISQILGVNIENILVGDLDENNKNGGNMNKIKFYVCPTCGNVLTAVCEADVSCCGRKLAPCESCSPNSDICVKHEIHISDVEDEYYVTLNHEMSKKHYISFVACVSHEPPAEPVA